MKKLIVSALVGLSAMTLLTGCLDLRFGGGPSTHRAVYPDVGKQLLDLQEAKANGAITEAEYQREKAKILNEKFDH